MKIIYRQTDILSPLNVLRKAGYSHFIDPNTGKESYILRTGPDFYPRFHLYVSLREQNKIEFNLHIDQKKAQYKGSHAHNAEYDGPVIDKEITRIALWIFKETNARPLNNDQVQAPEPKEDIRNQAPKPDMFGGIF